MQTPTLSAQELLSEINPTDSNLLESQPTAEQLKNYNDTHAKALSRLKRNADKPIDYSRATDHARQYMSRVNQSESVSQLDGIINRLTQTIQVHRRRQTLDFDTAKQAVSKVYELELARKGKAIRLGSDQMSILDDIIRYFIGDPASTIPLHKGIFLYGGFGVGKTFLFRTMQTLCRVVPLTGMEFDIVSTKALIQQVKEAKTTTPLGQYRKGNLLLDDLGEEAGRAGGDIQIYGNTEKVMDVLLSNRYELFDRFNLVTHATSNADVDDLEDIYGSRLYDRFCDMFEPVCLSGDSNRG